MSLYEMIYILSIPIHVIPVYKLNRCFLGEPQYGKRKEMVVYGIYGICLVVVFMITRKPIHFLLFSLVSFFIISLQYHSGMFGRIVYTVFLYLFLFIIEAVVWSVTGFFKLKAFENSEFNSAIGIVIMRIIMLIFSYLIQKFKTSRDKNVSVPIYYYIAQILVLFGILYFFLISLEKDFVSSGQVIISSLIVLLVNGIIVFVDEMVYGAVILSSETNLLRQQNIAYENQAKIMNHSMSTIRGIKHDMKNHMLILKVISQNKDYVQLDRYMDTLLLQMRENEPYARSGNFIVDSMINFKLQELEGENVSIQLEIHIPEHFHMLPFDLTVILGNLLDNAIAGIKESAKERTLKLCLHCTQGSLIILMDNSYSGTLHWQNGALQSTKKAGDNHGIGLKNVEKVIAKYEGELELSHTEDLFSVVVLLPQVY